MPPPFCVVSPFGLVGFVSFCGLCCPVEGLFPPPVVGVSFVEAGAGFAGAAVVVGFTGAGVGFAGGGGGVAVGFAGGVVAAGFTGAGVGFAGGGGGGVATGFTVAGVGGVTTGFEGVGVTVGFTVVGDGFAGTVGVRPDCCPFVLFCVG